MIDDFPLPTLNTPREGGVFNSILPKRPNLDLTLIEAKKLSQKKFLSF